MYDPNDPISIAIAEGVAKQDIPDISAFTRDQVNAWIDKALEGSEDMPNAAWLETFSVHIATASQGKVRMEQPEKLFGRNEREAPRMPVHFVHDDGRSAILSFLQGRMKLGFFPRWGADDLPGDDPPSLFRGAMEILAELGKPGDFERPVMTIALVGPPREKKP